MPEQNTLVTRNTFFDRFVLALATCGVGYLKPAPGTWGSAVGVLIFLLWQRVQPAIEFTLLLDGWRRETLEVIEFAAAIGFLALLAAVAIAVAGRAARILNNDDPSQVVIDEVAGQLVTLLLFVPVNAPWWYVLFGFLAFRLFDIWKPFPIHQLQNMHGGLGVVVDDLLAGIYAGVLIFVVASLV